MSNKLSRGKCIFGLSFFQSRCSTTLHAGFISLDIEIVRSWNCTKNMRDHPISPLRGRSPLQKSKFQKLSRGWRALGGIFHGFWLQVGICFRTGTVLPPGGTKWGPVENCVPPHPKIWRLTLNFYRAMLCIHGTSMGLCLCLSVCVCFRLCLSQVGVLLKRQNIGSHKQYHTIRQGV